MPKLVNALQLPTFNSLPSASSYAGYVIRFNNKPYYSDGTTWYEMTATGGSLAYLSIDVDIPLVASTPVVPYATNATAPTTLALTASRVYWIPFVIGFSKTVSSLQVNVTTASAGTHQIGIYDINTATGFPNNRLVVGNVDAGTTGVKSVTANYNLTAGTYWLAWASASAATVRALAAAGTKQLGLPSLGTTFNTHYYTSGSTLPNPAPTSGYTAGTGSTPVIALVF